MSLLPCFLWGGFISPLQYSTSLEVRSYNTEKRNSAAIFIGKDYVRAFLIVLTPPKSARRCIALEYNNSECDDVINYFNTIWDRHEHDIYV